MILARTGTVPPDPREPVFSHDGKHVAFIGTNAVGTASADLAVFVANADGSGCHVVVPRSPDQWHSIQRVVWSADDRTLYLGFQGNANNQPIQLWQVAVDGTGLQQVPGLPQSFQQIEPQVLADGRLAYSDGGGNDVIVFDPKTKTSSTVYTKLTGFLATAGTNGAPDRGCLRGDEPRHRRHRPELPGRAVRRPARCRRERADRPVRRRRPRPGHRRVHRATPGDRAGRRAGAEGCRDAEHRRRDCGHDARRL